MVDVDFATGGGYYCFDAVALRGAVCLRGAEVEIFGAAFVDPVDGGGLRDESGRFWTFCDILLRLFVEEVCCV